MADATTATSIESAFASARSEGRAALMPYLMGGFPDHETATAVATAYADAGADLIELGVPFSDPLADGPTIHAADTAALAAGATLDTVLETCGAVSDRLPVALMVYANMVLAADPVERASIGDALEARDLALMPLMAPTTPPARRAEICAVARGFVYLVSTVGVTGERVELPTELGELIAAAKAEADVPVAVGFGISTPEQAAAVGREADGVIIGTRLVREVGEANGRDTAVQGVTRFLRDTREALAG